MRVGQFHSAEIVMYVRRQDFAWFHRQQADQELMQMLQQKVLPRMFASEVEVSHAKKSGEVLPPPLGSGGIPIGIGETNLKQNGKGKRKRQQSKQQIKAESAVKRQDEIDNKKETDMHYAFGTHVQLAYRLLDEPKRKPPVTLVMRTESRHDPTQQQQQQQEKPLQQLIKLSKRVAVWCYPLESASPELDHPEPPSGMHRPDMIPLSDLFRKPKEEVQ